LTLRFSFGGIYKKRKKKKGNITNHLSSCKKRVTICSIEKETIHKKTKKKKSRETTLN
jgi:hypothetical protein